MIQTGFRMLLRDPLNRLPEVHNMVSAELMSTINDSYHQPLCRLQVPSRLHIEDLQRPRDKESEAERREPVTRWHLPLNTRITDIFLAVPYLSFS